MNLFILSSNSERTNWWDASFVYGNNAAMVEEARTKVGGKMITGKNPHAMAERKDGTYIAGDNKNSWVGVALLQDLFIREHNWIADQIAAEAAKEGKVMSDQELFVSTASSFLDSLLVLILTIFSSLILQLCRINLVLLLLHLLQRSIQSTGLLNF